MSVVVLGVPLEAKRSALYSMPPAVTAAPPAFKAKTKVESAGMSPELDEELLEELLEDELLDELLLDEELLEELLDEELLLEGSG